MRAGRLLLEAEFPEDASKLLEQASQRLGENQQANLLLAECYEQRGMTDVAARYRLRATKKQ